MISSVNSNSEIPMTSKKLDDKRINKQQQKYNNTAATDSVTLSKTAKPEKKGFFQKWGSEIALAGGAIILVAGGIFVKKKLDIKKAKELEAQAQKIAEEQAEKHRQEMLKQAEEARLAAEARKAEAAKRAEEAKLEAEQKAKARAEKETKLKQEHEAKLNRINANSRTTRAIRTKFEVLNVDKTILNRVIESHPDADWREIHDITQDLEVRRYYGLEWKEKLDKLTPKELIDSCITSLAENKKSGGDISIEDVKKLLEDQKGSIQSTKESMEHHQMYHISSKLDKFSNYFDDILKEIDAVNPKKGESAEEVLSRALNSLENKIKHRQEVYSAATESTSRQLEPIKKRLVYLETPDKQPSIKLSSEDKKALADELNNTCGLEGDRMLNPNTSIEDIAEIWKHKYISGYTPSLSQRTEDAILGTFPRYKAPAQNGNGEFKYKPVYRFMHIEDTEAFLKQFDEIGGIYSPGRLQSCTKYEHFGERNPDFSPRFHFSDLNPEQNIKFVIHPKSEVSKAADIGEGKYGATEVIYPGSSKFKILGKVKKKVTPEEMKEVFGPRIKNFEDFDRWEIHLQEI